MLAVLQESREAQPRRSRLVADQLTLLLGDVRPVDLAQRRVLVLTQHLVVGHQVILYALPRAIGRPVPRGALGLPGNVDLLGAGARLRGRRAAAAAGAVGTRAAAALAPLSRCSLTLARALPGSPLTLTLAGCPLARARSTLAGGARTLPSSTLPLAGRRLLARGLLRQWAPRSRLRRRGLLRQ